MYDIVELSDEFIAKQDTVDMWTLVGRELSTTDFQPIYDHYDEDRHTHYMMVKIFVD